MKKTFIILLVIIIFVFLSQSNKSKNNVTNTKNNIAELEIIKEDLTISPKEYLKESEYLIEGIVKNNTNKIVKNVRIRAIFYDNNNNKISEAMDYINSIDENGTWKFKLGLYSKEKLTYKLKLEY